MYLGIPLSDQRLSRGVWKEILDKLRSKVSHWIHRWLSTAGRMTLLKSVIQALPIYRGLVQSTPASFIKDFDALLRKFLWTGNFLSSKWSLVKWECVCRSKQDGGLGLRNTSLTGWALATKLFWRWCISQDQGWAKILNVKYLGGVDGKDVPRYNLTGRGSMTWETLKKGAQLVKNGLF